MSRRLVVAAQLLVGLLAAATPHQADASCNIIPGTTRTFRSTLATADRPFATPGDWVELDLASSCFDGAPALLPTAGEHVVTVAYKPIAPGAPRNLMFVSDDCAAIEAERALCAADPDVDQAECMEVGTVPAAPPAPQVGLQRPSVTQLRFRFPNSDALLTPADDLLSLAGPAAIAVTEKGDALPCDLVVNSCAAQPGLIACVDELFSADGSCQPNPHEIFTHFTALPIRNNYQAICVDPIPPCAATDDVIRFGVDDQGNLLIPMDWRGVLVPGAVPVARLLRGSSSVEAFEGDGVAMDVPSLGFLASYSPEGGRLPPLFDPQADPSDTSRSTFFGSADAPETVLRVLRRSPAFKACSGGDRDGLPCVVADNCPSGTCSQAQCVGGGNDGNPCSSDAACPAGECGVSLFDFSTRMAADVGPVVVELGSCLGGADAGTNCTSNADCTGGSCGEFDVAALDPVPLDGLAQTDTVNAFVVAEAVDNSQVNLDGDAVDHAIKLSDRETGSVQPIGQGGKDGRAVVRVRQPPYTFAALATEDEVIAFLESEPGENNADANSDDDVFDSILRVFRQDGGSAVELTQSNLSAEAEPLVNGRSLVVSGGRVFFRAAEVDDAPYEKVAASVGPLDVESDLGTTAFGGIAVSGDGNVVAFSSASTNLAAGDANGFGDVFVRDLGAEITERVSVDSAEDEANGSSAGAFAWPALSYDGAVVGFQSLASDLVGDDTNTVSDVFVRDRDAGTTERVSVDSAGVEGPGNSEQPALSADGDAVAFMSTAELDPLFPPDGPAANDIFVRTRSLADTEQVSTAPGVLKFFIPAISADARLVSFFATQAQIYDRETAITSDVSVDSFGNLAAEDLSFTLPQGLSADGRTVAFLSGATNLAAGDTNDEVDVFVRDLATGQTTRVEDVSVGQHDGQATHAALSADGRYVAFVSFAKNIDIDPSDTLQEAFLHDRLTGHTLEFSTTFTGAGIPVGTVSIDGSGRTMAFTTEAPDITAVTEGNIDFDVFVHRPEAGALGSDHTLDGAVDDTVLRVIDATVGPPGTLTTLCPAQQVAVAAGRAAFLRPEAAGATTNAGCTGADLTGPNLNGDADAEPSDTVVHLYDGSAVTNLRCAADAIALSDTHLAALVSEPDQAGAFLNLDGDADDSVVFVRGVGDAAPGACVGSTWTNLAASGDSVDVVGSLVAFATPEVSEVGAPDADLNDDGDTIDRVLQVYDAGALVPAMDNTGQAITDFVVGESLIAMRTNEAAHSDGAGGRDDDLNGDGDLDDDVLQVYDADAAPGQRLINTRVSVRACRLEACDPRFPYRALGDTVKFLSFECDEGGAETDGCVGGGTDLNGDGDAGDLVLRTFNVRRRQLSPSDPASIQQGALSTGICTDTADACVDDGDCGASAACFLPPGGCIEDLNTFCNPDPEDGPDCNAGEFCQPLFGMPGQGTCFDVQNPCEDDSDCIAPAFCSDGGAEVYRLNGPLSANTRGDSIYPGAGRCFEDVMVACTSNADCTAREFCGEDGSCIDDHGPCRTTADCPAGAACVLQLATTTAADVDLDEIPDPFDNCEFLANTDQTDTDADGVGDACDVDAGVCAALPLNTCRAAGKMQVQVKNSDLDEKDQLSWKWNKGDESLYPAFGTPATTTSYALCVYDSTGGTDALATELIVPPSSFWTTKVGKSWTYKRKPGVTDGVEQIKLKVGIGGKASASLKAKGLDVPLPDPVDPKFFDQDPRVTVQLVNSDGECWSVELTAVQASRNEPESFKAKGP